MSSGATKPLGISDLVSFKNKISRNPLQRNAFLLGNYCLYSVLYSSISGNRDSSVFSVVLTVDLESTNNGVFLNLNLAIRNIPPNRLFFSSQL